MKYKGQSVCPTCAIAAHRELAIDAWPDHQSIFLISNRQNTKWNEESIFSTLRGQASGRSKFAETLLTKASNSNFIDFHLYYQFSLNPLTWQTSFNTWVTIPGWKAEEEINHELWGYFKYSPKGAQVFINEYQYYWNGGYTLIHETFHLLDRKTQDYVHLPYVKEFIEMQKSLHSLDDFALEVRAILAEIYFRKDVREKIIQGKKAGIDFGLESDRCDFRDKYLNKSWGSDSITIDHDAVIKYALDLFYPVSEKSLADKIILPDSMNEIDAERSGLYVFMAAIEDLISNFNRTNQTTKTPARYLPFSKETRIVKFRAERKVIEDELKRRGFGNSQDFLKNLKDYLHKSGLLEPIDEISIRSDGQLNRIPFKKGGPSPRVGGGGA